MDDHVPLAALLSRVKIRGLLFLVPGSSHRVLTPGPHTADGVK